MKTVIANWPELKEAIQKADKLDRLVWEIRDPSWRLFYQTKINHYCDPGDPLYRSEEYYQGIKEGIAKKIEEGKLLPEEKE